MTGCICPPTSERTCKNPTCPRKDHRTLGEKMRDANSPHIPDTNRMPPPVQG